MLSAALAIMLALGTPTQVNGDIEAPGPSGPLKRTLVLPAKDAPIILMIPGSGPTDRDGNSPLGVRAVPYRLLAEGLAGQGIGSVRIDKRGMFGSQSAVRDAKAVTIDDYVHDTGAWVDAIRARTGVRCVWLLGHSEGALVALAAASKVDHLCGLALVATAGRPLGDVLKEQLRARKRMKERRSLIRYSVRSSDRLFSVWITRILNISKRWSPFFGQGDKLSSGLNKDGFYG